MRIFEFINLNLEQSCGLSGLLLKRRNAGVETAMERVCSVFGA